MPFIVAIIEKNEKVATITCIFAQKTIYLSVVRSKGFAFYGFVHKRKIS